MGERIKLIFSLIRNFQIIYTFLCLLQLKVTNNDNDIDIVDRTADRCADDLEKQCETLQQRLDQVQKEILKILSEKRACSEENCALKLQISELMTRLPGGSDLGADQANGADVRSSVTSTSAFSTAICHTWSPSLMAARSSSPESLENRVLCDAEALQFVENESRLAEPPTPEKAEEHTAPSQTIDATCSSMLTAVSEEENEMEWKTIGDEQKASEEATGGSPTDTESVAAAGETHEKPVNYKTLLQNYDQLAKEKKTLSDKCEELSSCLELLRSEYDSCEEYWASKLDEERQLFEEVIRGVEICRSCNLFLCFQ